ncbi:putative ribosomal protein S11 [Raphanus sativus]|uniref:Probable ribosomal protein S11, mitochondrial n=1 Tax=Raphanus sativus TaxID=3726 RepID=A0A6J0MV67_RAPSA|nr:probable ribosomal protein S11, mitochondrial [Raphanus sativus]KAJ4917007.1 putative ribosomal protein S11 [Raphanus sativus]
MNGVSRHLRASPLPSLIRSYGGIKSVCRFSSQSDGFSGGREQGPVTGNSENKSAPPDPNASPSKTFSEIKAGLLNSGGGGKGTSSTFSSFSELRSGLLNRAGDGGYPSPNAPPTFKNPFRSRLPNTLPSQSGEEEGLPSTGGSGFSSAPAPSYQSFTQSNLFKDNFRTGGISKDLDFVRGVIEEDEGRRVATGGLFSHFHRPNLETNADIIHIKLLRNNTFVTVTDSKGNVKCKATSGSVPDLKGGRKMTSYTADATAENIGRRVKAMGLKSVVVKVNGFTHFKKKRNAIVAFRSGYSNSRNDQNPIVYIEDTTRKAHNGCRLPRKRRV